MRSSDSSGPRGHRPSLRRLLGWPIAVMALVVVADRSTSLLVTVGVLAGLGVVAALTFSPGLRGAGDRVRHGLRASVAVASVPAVILLTEGSPERWAALVALQATVAVVVTPWWARLAWVPLATLVFVVAALMAGARGPMVALAAVIVSVNWIFLSALRAHLQRTLDVAARARSRAERRRHVLGSVARLTTTDPRELVARVVAAAGEAAEVPTVLAAERVDHGLVVIAAATAAGQRAPARLPLRSGVTSRVLVHGGIEVVDDYARDPDAREVPGLAVGAVIIVPVLVDEAVAGVLVLIDDRPRAWRDETVRFVEALAVQVGRGLDVARRIRHQRQLVERLADLDRAKTAFLTRVSTDLRSPMMQLEDLARSLEARADVLAPDEATRLLAQFDQQSVRLSHMLTTLLDFSRSREAGAQIEAVDVGELAHDVATTLSSRHGHRSVAVAVRGPVDVDADRNLLRLALERLLEHALVSTRGEARVDVEVIRDGADVVVRVRDDGPGLPDDVVVLLRSGGGPELLATVDERLLGLAIGAHALESLGTRVSVEPVVSGTSLRFRLPASWRPMSGPPRDPASERAIMEVSA